MCITTVLKCGVSSRGIFVISGLLRWVLREGLFLQKIPGLTRIFWFIVRRSNNPGARFKERPEAKIPDHPTAWQTACGCPFFLEDS